MDITALNELSRVKWDLYLYALSFDVWKNELRVPLENYFEKYPMELS